MAKKCSLEKLAKRKAYYYANREKAVDYSRAWYAANKDRAKKSGKLWRSKNCEKRAGVNKAWYNANPNRVLASTLKKRGWDLESYEKAVELQGNLCAICFMRCKLNQRLSADHDHITGSNRGLLCSACNFVLGHARDSVDILRNAVFYLNKHSRNSADYLYELERELVLV